MNLGNTTGRARLGTTEFRYELACGCEKISGDAPPIPVPDDDEIRKGSPRTTWCWGCNSMQVVLSREPTGRRGNSRDHTRE